MDDKNYAKIFSENLKYRRKAAGLTQKQLAEKLGYTEKSVSKWESGETVTPSIILPKLSSLLGVSIDELLLDSTEPNYYLGVDGGATKTEFLLCDKNRKVVSRVILGGSNPVDIGLENCLKLLKSGIEQVLDGIDPSMVSAFVGIAGGITGDFKQRIPDLLSTFRFASFSNGSDAENAVAAALGEDDGIAVIAGTGSIAFIKQGDRLTRVGGWGHLLENGGDGYYIGRDGIYYSLLMEEGSLPLTPLYERIKEKSGKEKMLDAIADLYKGGKRELASFAPAVFEAADMGDEVAKGILDRNSMVIAELINRAKTISGEKEIRAVIVGGLMSRKDLLVPMIKKYLDDGITLGVYTDPPVYGAVTLAKAFKPESGLSG